ncbi:hypothetical protein SUGI_0806190 [Cryptomeria japonica]|nr:hypothetical protein SUGI_0806190 [Cryptomeria japonica]
MGSPACCDLTVAAPSPDCFSLFAIAPSVGVLASCVLGVSGVEVCAGGGHIPSTTSLSFASVAAYGVAAAANGIALSSVFLDMPSSSVSPPLPCHVGVADNLVGGGSSVPLTLADGFALPCVDSAVVGIVIGCPPPPVDSLLEDVANVDSLHNASQPVATDDFSREFEVPPTTIDAVIDSTMAPPALVGSPTITANSQLCSPPTGSAHVATPLQQLAVDPMQPPVASRKLVFAL